MRKLIFGLLLLALLGCGDENYSNYYSNTGVCNCPDPCPPEEEVGVVIKSVTKSPTSYVYETSVGTLGFYTPENIYSSNNAYAYNSCPGACGYATYYLVGKGFEFSIPSTAEVIGIKVRIERKSTNSGAGDNSVKIYKGGSIAGNEKKLAGAWPASDAYVEYGGSSDLWGVTWEPPDINDSDFGVGLSMSFGGPPGYVYGGYLDHYEITVYYRPIASLIAVFE